MSSTIAASQNPKAARPGLAANNSERELTAGEGTHGERAWPSAAVFSLDRWLRRRFGIYEFCTDPHCLLRIQCVRADEALEFADGTCVRAGSAVLALHLWNEHVPAMGRRGPTLAWATRADQAIRISLRELARYLRGQPALADVAALCADVRVADCGQAERLARILLRCGFEKAPGSVDRRGVLHRFGDAVLVAMLMSATNPCALRRSPLRRRNVRFILSRTALERRYGATRDTREPVGQSARR